MHLTSLGCGKNKTLGTWGCPLSLWETLANSFHHFLTSTSQLFKKITNTSDYNEKIISCSTTVIIRYLATKYLIITTERSYSKFRREPENQNNLIPFMSTKHSAGNSSAHNALRFILCLLVLWLTAILNVSSFLHTLCCLRPDKIPEYHTRLPRKSLWWNAKYCTCGTAENRHHILLSVSQHSSNSKLRTY